MASFQGGGEGKSLNVLGMFQEAGTRQVVDLKRKKGVFWRLFLVFENYIPFPPTAYIVDAKILSLRLKCACMRLARYIYIFNKLRTYGTNRYKPLRDNDLARS